MDERKKRGLIIMALAGIIFCGSYYGYWQKNAVPETLVREQPPEPPRSAMENYPTVYVSGAVMNPGLYKVAPGSRVPEAIRAAGGLAPEADVNRVNMAKLLKDGLQVHVPSLAVKTKKTGESKAAVRRADPKPPAGDSAKPRPDGEQAEEQKISINTGSRQDLEKLPGIGPALAERIIAYREANGLFRDIAELKNVQGIGEAKYNQLKDKATL